MNGSRRPVTWRLVVMLVAGFALTTTGAFAQTQKLRVKLGPANVYERPRTSSDVVMVAPEGTVLEVLKREDTWYWVMLPPDGNGQRRAGYIAAYLVELIGAKGPDAMPVPAPPALATRPPVVKAGYAAGTPRFHVGIGGGGQTASAVFADNVAFPLYDETGRFQAAYVPPKSSALDASFGIQFGQRFVLAVAFWHATPVSTAAVTAVVPHPFSYNTPRLTAADGIVTNRVENDTHLQLTWLLPLSPKVDLSIFAGPSLMYVRQDLISGLALRESFPYDSVAISGVTTVRNAKAAVGANVGVGVTVAVWRYLGVGVTGRYARAASLKMPSADAGTFEMQVGGAQVSGGLRVRF